jgi:hypothetical protein
MRTVPLHLPSFIGGVAVGIAAAAVTVLTIEAARRRRAHGEKSDDRVVIDGARDIDPVELDVMLEPETPREPLANESPSYAPESQRW